MATGRFIKDKRYEEKHKEERKAKYMIWGTSVPRKYAEEIRQKDESGNGWCTSVPRKYAEEINEFLAKYGFTKVQLIKAGCKALADEATETDTSLAKIMDGYDDFFVLEKPKH